VRGGESLVDLLAPQPGESILDVGCGTGHLTAQIAQRGAAVVGIDSSAAMVERARAAYPQLDFRLADATDLRFERAFDAVFSNAALHWIPRASQPLVGRSIARSLRDGGRLVAELGGKGNVERIVRALEATIVAMGYHLPADPWCFPGVAEYAALLEEAGLEVVLAELFERPTPLDGGERGMSHWLSMFAGHFLTAVPAEKWEELVGEVERLLRPEHYRENGWIADYRRLRLVAIRRGERMDR
jgi:trans-aconitate methyltransferase